jgi:elongation factor P--beta-lysine ligase
VFNPSRDEVRRFFCDAWRKRRAGEVLTPLEATALKWVDVHPEYHALLEDADSAVTADFSVERGQSNPFLHLSMHLAIEEQLSIDQPSGIRAVFMQLAARAGSEHDAVHEAMECLGRVLWESQRGVLPADPQAINDAYIECLRRRATS